MNEDDVVVVGDKKKPPPTTLYLRWSKVLNKWVLGDETDKDTIIYKMK